MKDTDTLDSLLANKEQTDKALAELADSLREKLDRLEAVIGRWQTTDHRRRQLFRLPAVSYLKTVTFYAIVLVALIGVFALGQYIGGSMTAIPLQSQCHPLCRQYPFPNHLDWK